MNKLMRIYKSKGFTLVECVVAIAVFAVLTSMVMLILANTTTLSKTAAQNEENLGNLVENVVMDNSKVVYGSDSEQLKLKVNDQEDKLLITYMTVEGNKDFIKCTNPSCGHDHSIKDYLRYIEESETYDKALNKADHPFTYWFNRDFAGNLGNAATSNFVCPDCQTSFSYSTIQFVCLGCLNTKNLVFDPALKSTGMYYNGDNNTIICGQCGGGNVISAQYYDPATGQVNINNTGDSNFMLNTIRPNAIRYGTVQQETSVELAKKLITISSTAATPLEDYIMDINPKPRANKGDTVKYHVVMSAFGSAGSGIGDDKDDATKKAQATVRISIPGLYICNVLPNTNINTDRLVNDTKPKVIVENSADITRADSYSTIVVSNITDTNAASVNFDFTLTNYSNANSFEDDYAAELKKAGGPENYTGSECALMRFWFRNAGSRITFPRADTSFLDAVQEPKKSSEEKKEEE